jgi:2-methylcitrate dehydratase PrpD
VRESSKPMTRRSVMKQTAVLSLWPLVSTNFPSTTAATSQVISTGQDIMAELSNYMSEAANRPLPPEAAESAKLHILDTMAAMISGIDLPPAQEALRFVRAFGGEKVATVVGTDLVCGPAEAALANGMLAHSDETDDSHSASHSHPGCAVIPASLAVAERFGIDGNRFLRAVALGYDVGTRVTMTLGGLQYQMDSHRSAHSIAGTFGACAAAASVAGLKAQQMRWVLDYAAQQASGIAAWQRDTQHVEKSLVFGGFPARNGVTAALLIQSGATGVNDIFTGSDNFVAAYNPAADLTNLVDGLGHRYEVTQTNIKKWTVGSPIQAPLDALDLILRAHTFAASQVRNVTVRLATSEAKTVDNRDMPDINLQHMIATMLVDRTITFRSAHDKSRMQDPGILDVRGKIEIIRDEELEKLYPRLVAIVQVTLNNGDRFTERVDAVRGTVGNPMSAEEVEAKARVLMVPFLGNEQTVRLVQAILHLESLNDIQRLRPLLQRT